jgi:hypothetical protein
MKIESIYINKSEQIVSANHKKQQILLTLQGSVELKYSLKQKTKAISIRLNQGSYWRYCH